MTLNRFLLTGAEGFVGHHMLAALRNAFPESFITAGVHAAAELVADAVVEFDLLSAESVAALLARARPDACIHLAAFSDVGASFAAPDAAWAVNVDGARILAQAIMAAFPDCVLLNAGSADVYGLSFRAGVPLDEDGLLQPANPYAASKAASDLMLGEMALRGLRVIRMRPLNHVGPGQSPRFAVASFARQVARIAAGVQAPVIETGTLESAREFLDVRDVCGAYAAVLRRADVLPVGCVFNLSSETPRSLRSVLQDLLDLAGVAAEIRTVPSVVRPTDVGSSRCSAAALRRMTGWEPGFAWGETLRDVLSYWRKSVL